MTQHDTDPDPLPPALHQQAEMKSGVTDTLGQARPSPEEIQFLVQELHVRQIELEMQNEELRRAQAELEASRARYFDLYDLAPVGYLAVSYQGLILEANLTAAELLGVARDALLGQPVRRFIFSADQELYDRHCHVLFESGAPQTCELRMVRPNDSPFWAEVQAAALQDAVGRRICRTVISDITARKQTKAALHESEQRLHEAHEMLEAVTQGTNVIIAAIGTDFRYTYFNQAYQEEVQRLSGEAIRIGASMVEAFARMPEQQQVVIAEWTPALRGEKTNKTLEFGEAGSYRRVYDILHTPIRDASGHVIGAGEVAYDVTEKTHTNEKLRAQREELAAANAELRTRTAQLAQTNLQLQRLNRTLLARSNCSRAFMQTASEADFVNEVCRIVVEDCGYAMAWIGYAEEDEGKTVNPVACAGLEAGYLETLQITWSDRERGRGPTGVAIRTGRPSACHDMRTDPQFAPWREQALKRGYAASLVLPLLANGRAFGALSIYFTEPDPFSEDEVALLSGLADDVANGIQTIRLRAAHARAEAALQAAHDELEKRVAERTRDLQTANALLEKVFASVDLLIAYLDRDFNFIRVNRAYAEASQYAPEYFAGKNLFGLSPDAGNEAIFRRVVETGEAYSAFEQPFVLVAPDSAVPRYWDWSLQPLPDAAGSVQGLVFSLVDVTQRKQAEDELRQSAWRAHAIAEISQAAVEVKLDDHSAMEAMAYRLAALFDDACLIVLFSQNNHLLTVQALRHPDPAVEADLRQCLSGGRPHFEVGRIAGQLLQTGKPVLVPAVSSAPGLEWIPPDFRQAVAQIGLQSLLAVPLHAQERIIGQLLLLRLRPNAPYSVEDQMTVQSLADRAALAITNTQLYRDLETALAQEQAIRQQLVQAEKLGALGRMVSSVAHELNNPLQTIRNCLYLTGQELSADSPIHDYLEMANSETQRLVKLVAQLRELYRPHTARLVPQDLASLLQSVRSLMAPQLASGQVQWQQSADWPCYRVPVISDRLKQVFINVVTNAIEAMQPGGGQLLVDITPSADGRQVGVSFRDTGPGIAPEHLSRIFEPFFTSKSQGLGLGLSICYEIAQQHGGQITAESQPGQGAVFTVWLPLAERVEGGDTEKTIGGPNHASP